MLNSLKQFTHNITYTLNLLWQESRTLTSILLLLTCLESPLLSIQLLLVKQIIDTVTISIQTHTSTHFSLIITFVTLQFGLLFLQNLLSQITALTFPKLGNALQQNLTSKVLTKASELDLSFYENHTSYDLLSRVRQEGINKPIELLQQFTLLIRTVITLISLLLAIIHFPAFAILGLFIGALFSLASDSQLAFLEYSILNFQIPGVRKMFYLAQLLTSHKSIRELRLFGLETHFQVEHAQLLRNQNKEKYQLTKKRAWRSLIASALSSVIYAGLLLILINDTLLGQLSIGDLTLFTGIFIASQGQLAMLIGAITSIYKDTLFLDNLQTFLQLKPQLLLSNNPKPLPPSLQHGITFQNVHFTYPNAATPTLHDISFTAHPGEIIALVGENGAGKTTLIKLLCRLYDPSHGNILLDNTDLKEYPVEQLYQQFSAIFQDFLQHEATVSENIGYGNLAHLHDTHTIQKAASQATADTFINNLPEGYDTTLGKFFSEGHELSTGQWQKIALARALFRQAPIIILDEPTASLDPQSEADIFSNLKSHLSQGQIGLIVSHRFSTVKLAHRILVLEHGTITEAGTHNELLQQGGLYAHLYHTQASNYTA